MRAYSVDLRHRIVDALENGATQEETAKRFCVSLATVKRYKRQWQEQANLTPKPIPGRVPHIKNEEHEEFLTLVASQSDWTLTTLSQAWHERKGVKPTVSVLSATCKRLRITHKKRVASPRKETPTSVMPSRRK